MRDIKTILIMPDGTPVRPEIIDAVVAHDRVDDEKYNVHRKPCVEVIALNRDEIGGLAWGRAFECETFKEALQIRDQIRDSIIPEDGQVIAIGAK